MKKYGQENKICLSHDIRRPIMETTEPKNDFMTHR